MFISEKQHNRIKPEKPESLSRSGLSVPRRVALANSAVLCLSGLLKLLMLGYSGKMEN